MKYREKIMNKINLMIVKVVPFFRKISKMIGEKY